MPDEPLKQNSQTPVPTSEDPKPASPQDLGEEKQMTPIPPKTLPTEESTLTLENFHTMAKDISDVKKNHGVMDKAVNILEGITPGPLEEIPTEALPGMENSATSKPAQVESEEVNALAHALEVTEDTLPADAMNDGKELTLEVITQKLPTRAPAPAPLPEASPRASQEAPVAPQLTTPAQKPAEPALPDTKPDAIDRGMADPVPASKDPNFVLFPEAKKIAPPPPTATEPPLLVEIKPRTIEAPQANTPPQPETAPVTQAQTKPLSVPFTQAKSAAGINAFVGMPKAPDTTQKPADTYREPIEEAPTPIMSVPEPDIVAPIHTLRSDVGEAVARHNVTLSGIAIKEDSRRRMEADAVVKKSLMSKMLVAFAFLLFVGGAGALGYVLYLKKTPEEKIIQQVEETSLIFSETKLQFDVTNLSADAIRDKTRSHLATTNLRVGTIEDIVVTRRVEIEGETQYALVTAPEFLSRTALSKNTSLDRFITPEFMLGVYSFKNFSGFLILKTTVYQSVFAEMLAWEPKLARDAGFLVSDKPFDEETLSRKWEDRVIENTDVRVLKDANGEVVMLWSFLGTRDTLLITRNIDTFKEILTREKTPRKVYR